MSEPSLKPNLFETGTRWQHYNELLDLFSSGVEVLSHLPVKSRGDTEKAKKLQAAVEMIEGRLNYITDYHTKTTTGSTIRKVVDGPVDDLYRDMKRERINDAEKAKNPPADDDGESPEAYTTK